MEEKSRIADSFEHQFFSSPSTYIHPTAIIGHNVTLEEGVKIGPYVTITGTVHIGAHTKIYPHATIGFPAQNLSTKTPLGTIAIGSHGEIREFVTIHASKYENGIAHIGNHCYLMSYAHVAHDVILEDHVTLINNVNLGGHTHVEEHAVMMAHSATHQFCRIGKFAAVSPYSATRQDLPPFCLYVGGPAQFNGLNLTGLKRNGFSDDDLSAIRHLVKLFYRDKLPLKDVEQHAQTSPWGSNQFVHEFISFAHKSSRGISRRSVYDNHPHTKQ